MSIKEKRHMKILDLIREYDIETQETLQLLLSEHGFDVTQATVSRDIRELRLAKTLSADGVYKYASPIEADSGSVRFKSIFSDSVVKIDRAMNTVVLKCHTGTAQAACAAFDAMELDNVVGTIAGDDTIFILMRNERCAVSLVETLGSLLKG